MTKAQLLDFCAKHNIEIREGKISLATLEEALAAGPEVDFSYPLTALYDCLKEAYADIEELKTVQNQELVKIGKDAEKLVIAIEESGKLDKRQVGAGVATAISPWPGSAEEKKEDEELAKEMGIQYDLMNSIFKALKGLEASCKTYNEVMVDKGIQALMSNQAKKAETDIKALKDRVFKLLNDTI